MYTELKIMHYCLINVKHFHFLSVIILVTSIDLISAPGAVHIKQPHAWCRTSHFLLLLSTMDIDFG